jgi:microcystin-dependent protein
VKASSTSVTLAATNAGSGTLITIGGQQYSVSSTLTLNTGTVGANGLDAGTLAVNSKYYVYAVLSAGSPALVASLNAPSTGPTGFAPYTGVGIFKTLATAATIDFATGINPTAPGVDSDRANFFTSTNSYVPPGVMFDYAGATAPSSDWLMCDGTSYAVAAYPSLFAAIGYSYGGAGANFNVPDFRGRFARYNDNMGTGAAGRDTGRAHGSTQTDTMQGHSHTQTQASAGILAGGSQTFSSLTYLTAVNGSSGYGAIAFGSIIGAPNDNGSGTPRTATETRPINLSCNKIIKV